MASFSRDIIVKLGALMRYCATSYEPHLIYLIFISPIPSHPVLPLSLPIGIVLLLSFSIQTALHSPHFPNIPHSISIAIKIKKANAATKFKLRFSTQLYTLVVKNKKQAAKIRKSLPATLIVKDISTHKPKA